MVTEDYPPFLINEIYLQDIGLLSYPHHGPLDRVNWVLYFWVDARGQDALSGLPLFWGPGDGPANGAYFQTLSYTIIQNMFLKLKHKHKSYIPPMSEIVDHKRTR